MNEYKLLFQQRHNNVDKELKEVANRVFTKYNTSGSVICQYIGYGFGVTGQTVVNYVNGKGKDGFLKEAILKAFKKYKE